MGNGCDRRGRVGRRRSRLGRRIIGRAGVAALLSLGTVTGCGSGGTSHGRVVASPAVARAVAETVRAGSAQFTLTVGLSKSLAAFLGDAARTTVSGTGQVDFTKRRASWSIALPSSLGSTVQAIADGSTTYVSYQPIWPAGGSNWIELSSDADYSAFDTVPWIRDLVVLTNPLRMLDLVDSTPGTPHTISSVTGPADTEGHVMVLAGWSRSPVEPGVCVPTLSSSGAWTGDVAGEVSAGASAEAGVMKAWADGHVAVDAGRAGVCDATISVDNPDGLGFDVKLSVTQLGIPVTVAGVKGKVTVSFSQTLHETTHPCWVGSWSGTTSVTVPPSPEGGISELTGGGSVDLKLSDPTRAPGDAAMNTDEDLTGTESGSNFGVGIAYGAQQLHFHREIVALGTVSTPNNSAIEILAHGEVSLNESGAIVGSRATTLPARSLLLEGTYSCETMDLHSTLTAYHLHKVSGGPPASLSVGAASLSVNWRPVAAQDGNSSTTTTPSSTTPNPAPSPPSVGLGASQASWNTNHVADPQVPNGYDPKPGRYPGSYFQDEFLNVIFSNGKLQSYEQQLAPSTTQAQASATVRAFLPPDVAVIIPATNLGTCAQEILQSPALAAAAGSGSGGISVVYASDYTSSSKNYDPSNVRTATVTIQPGGLPQSASELSSMACG